MSEPRIVINGEELNESLAMTVRVAVSHFYMDVANKGLGEHVVGKKLARGYCIACEKLERLMLQGQEDTDV